MITHKQFATPYYEIKVIERSDGTYIATRWCKLEEFQVDREVYEFETYGGAVDKAFDLLQEISIVLTREQASWLADYICGNYSKKNAGVEGEKFFGNLLNRSLELKRLKRFV